MSKSPSSERRWTRHRQLSEVTTQRLQSFKVQVKILLIGGQRSLNVALSPSGSCYPLVPSLGWMAAVALKPFRPILRIFTRVQLDRLWVCLLLLPERDKAATM